MLCPDDIDIISWNALPFEIQLEIIAAKHTEEESIPDVVVQRHECDTIVGYISPSAGSVYVDPSFKPTLGSIDGRKETRIASSEGPQCPNVDQCHCQLKATIRQVSKQGPNQGRYYSSCNKRKCNFFAWADYRAPAAAGTSGAGVNYKYQNLEWLPFLPGGTYCLMNNHCARLMLAPPSGPTTSVQGLGTLSPLSDDILQGGVGDCWFLGALAVVAERPDLLRRVLRPLLAGAAASVSFDDPPASEHPLTTPPADATARRQHDPGTIVDMTNSDDEEAVVPTSRVPRTGAFDACTQSPSVLNLPADGKLVFSLFIDGYWRDIAVDSYLPCRKRVSGDRNKNKSKTAVSIDSCFQRNKGGGEGDESSTDVRLLLGETAGSTLPTLAFCKPSPFFQFVPDAGSSGGGSGRYCLGQQLWVPFLEKAYAKSVGSYNAIHGGEIDEALLDLTGCPTEKIVFSHSHFDSEEFWVRLCSFNEIGFPMGASSGNGGGSTGGDGLSRLIVGNHAYSVLNVVQLSQMEAYESGLVALTACGARHVQTTVISDYLRAGGGGGGASAAGQGQVHLSRRPQAGPEDTQLRWLKLRNPWGVTHRNSVSNTSNDLATGRTTVVGPGCGAAAAAGGSIARAALLREIVQSASQAGQQRCSDDDKGSFWMSYHEFLVKFEDVNVCKAHAYSDSADGNVAVNGPVDAKPGPGVQGVIINTTTNHALSRFNKTSSLALGQGQWSFLSINDFTSPNQLLTRSYFLLQVPAVCCGADTGASHGVTSTVWVYFTVLQKTKRGSYASASAERNRYWYTDSTLIVSAESSDTAAAGAGAGSAGGASSGFVYGSTSSGCKRSSRSLECQLGPGTYRITVTHFLPRPEPTSYVLRLYSSRPVHALLPGEDPGSFSSVCSLRTVPYAASVGSGGFETPAAKRVRAGYNSLSTTASVAVAAHPRSIGEDLLARVLSGCCGGCGVRERMTVVLAMPAAVSGAAIIDLTDDAETEPSPIAAVESVAAAELEVYCLRLCGSVRVLQLEVCIPSSHDWSVPLAVSVSVGCCGFKVCSPYLMLQESQPGEASRGLEFRRDFQIRGRVNVYCQSRGFGVQPSKEGATMGLGQGASSSSSAGMGAVSALNFYCLMPLRHTGSVVSGGTGCRKTYKARVILGVFIACSLPYEAIGHSITLWGHNICAAAAAAAGRPSVISQQPRCDSSQNDLPAVFRWATI